MQSICTLDVVFGTTFGDLIALNGSDGTELWNISLANHMDSASFGIDHGPIVLDMDNDDTLDVFVVGGHGEYPAIEKNWGRAYAVSAGVGGPDWPMFRRDIVRSACAGYYGSSSIKEVNSSRENLNIWPNPGDGNFMIKSQGKAGSTYELSIYNLSGMLVYHEFLTSEEQSFYHKVHAQSLKSGLYIVKLMSEDIVQTAKVCIQ
ncbi:MAG: T9SS type A sorting domain-containing protein [Bacteroidota bacterium]